MREAVRKYIGTWLEKCDTLKRIKKITLYCHISVSQNFAWLRYAGGKKRVFCAGCPDLGWDERY